MDNIKDDLYHLNKMIHYIETAENYAERMAHKEKRSKRTIKIPTGSFIKSYN